MAIICLDIINQHLKRDMISMGDSTEQNPDIQQIQTRMEKFEVVRYVCRYWVDHVVDSDTCDNPLYNRLSAFFTHDALHWIEGMSLTGQLEYGIGSLDQLRNWLNVRLNLIRLIPAIAHTGLKKPETNASRYRTHYGPHTRSKAPPFSIWQFDCQSCLPSLLLHGVCSPENCPIHAKPVRGSTGVANIECATQLVAAHFDSSWSHRQRHIRVLLTRWNSSRKLLR